MLLQQLLWQLRAVAEGEDQEEVGLGQSPAMAIANSPPWAALPGNGWVTLSRMEPSLLTLVLQVSGVAEEGCMWWCLRGT